MKLPVRLWSPGALAGSGFYLVVLATGWGLRGRITLVLWDRTAVLAYVPLGLVFSYGFVLCSVQPPRLDARRLAPPAFFLAASAICLKAAWPVWTWCINCLEGHVRETPWERISELSDFWHPTTMIGVVILLAGLPATSAILRRRAVAAQRPGGADAATPSEGREAE